MIVVYISPLYSPGFQSSFPPSVLSIVFYTHGLTKGWFVGCREEPASREARRDGFYACADRQAGSVPELWWQGERGAPGTQRLQSIQVWEQYRDREALVSAGRIQ